MGESLTSTQMRALEQAAITSGAVTGLALMERAGQGVVAALHRSMPQVRRAVVLCGPGNNGGDGYVIARLLLARGWQVEVFAFGDLAGLPPDAKTNYIAWSEIGDIMPLQALGVDRLVRGASELVFVDALFGIGQRAPLDAVLAPFHATLDAMMDSDTAQLLPSFLSVDIPTGYDADTGAQLARRPFPADLIVTFHSRKPLHDMPHFLDTQVVVADIGLGVLL